MRLLLTRSLEQAGPLKEKLESEGFQVICLPLIEINPPADRGLLLKKALQHITQYQWLILTSRNTVQILQACLKQPPERLKIVAVGKATAQLAQKGGWEVLSPEKKEGVEALIDFFKEMELAGQRVLYPRSQIGMEGLASFLRKKGAQVDVIEAYQTRPSRISKQELQTVLEMGMDGIVFFSPSAVSSFFKKTDRENSLLKKTALIPFGRTTAFVLKREGFQPAFIPTRPEADRLAAELKRFFTGARE